MGLKREGDARRAMPLPGWALAVIAAALLYRLFVASQTPLYEDEAYFWSWSLHPAFGYPDHPPMVAWLIALGSKLGTSPLALRLPFIICIAIAAFALGRATALLSGNAYAAGVAATIVSLIPGPHWNIGLARPDPPYVCCWAIALMLAARIEKRPTWIDFSLLGIALGGAILSRVFGWGLVAGIVLYALAPARRALWRNGLWLSLLIAGALYVPFLFWNATHGWENLKFTAHERQALISYLREPTPIFLTLRFYAFAAAFIVVSWFVSVRRGHALIAWTALPLVLILSIVSIFQTVESVWLRGPFTSLIVDLSVAYTAWLPRRRWFWKIAGGSLAAFSMATFLVMAAPEGAQAWVQRTLPISIRDAFYSGVYSYRPLARDVHAISQRTSSAVLSDRDESVGELLYNGVPDPIMIGPAPQGPQWRRWYDPENAVPYRSIFVSDRALEKNPDIARRLRGAYQSVSPGPVLEYSFAHRRAGTYYTVFCAEPRAGAAALLFGG